MTSPHKCMIQTWHLNLPPLVVDQSDTANVIKLQIQTFNFNRILNILYTQSRVYQYII